MLGLPLLVIDFVCKCHRVHYTDVCGLFIHCSSVVSSEQLYASPLQNVGPDCVETDTGCLHHPVIDHIPGRKYLRRYLLRYLEGNRVFDSKLESTLLVSLVPPIYLKASLSKLACNPNLLPDDLFSERNPKE